MLFFWALAFILVLQEQDFSVFQCATQSCSARCYVDCSELNDEQSFDQQPDQDDQHAWVFERGKTASAAADPVSVPPGSSERSVWCSQHTTIHKRLDAIEEVEKTVEYLESEMKTLLKDISETGWSASTATGPPLMDIFDDAS